jgi:peptidoglycan hydrolase CwlO-like protein
MDQTQFLGYLVVAVVTIGGFIGVIMKFIQPINELRVVIQKLNDNIDSLKKNNDEQNKKLENHDTQIDKLDRRVGKIETKMDLFHKNN